DYQTRGRLSASVLAALGLPRDADAYLCGPAAFMAEMSAALAGLGVGRVRTQQPDGSLGPGPGQPARAGRSVRRAGALVVPDRRVPHVRDGPAVRDGQLRPRPGG